MLTNENNYFVSRGVPASALDLSRQVPLGVKPSQTNLGYSYGVLEDQQSVRERKMRQAFTGDYAEMLHNPEKKMLLLGLHPEMNTLKTKEIQPEMASRLE